VVCCVDGRFGAATDHIIIRVSLGHPSFFLDYSGPSFPVLRLLQFLNSISDINKIDVSIVVDHGLLSQQIMERI
jgi:hypothetical protein